MDYTDLADSLRYYATHVPNLSASFYSHLWQAADAIEELLQKTQQLEWIPVTERLPKYGDWVLGIGPKRGYHVCEYRGVTHFPYSGDIPWFSAKGRSLTITHWMPLPEPPKESTVYESIKTGLEQAISGEYREETVAEEGEG